MNERENFLGPSAKQQPQRKDPKQISFRVSESEYATLQRSAETLHMSVPAFVKSRAQRTKIVMPKIDRPGAIEIAKQLRGIGNNVNQMARALNTDSDSPNASVTIELDRVREELNQIWQQLN